MMNKITFKTWILKFECVDWPIGDLASDIKSDRYFPKANDKETILNHLISKNASNAAIETFNDAWDYYLKSR